MTPGFDLDAHRLVARRAAAGEATGPEVAASQADLLKEMIRLTGVLPVDTSDMAYTANFGGLISTLSKAPGSVIVYVETDGHRDLAGAVGSYRTFHDHLRVTVGSDHQRTVSELHKRLLDIKRSGFENGSMRYIAPHNTPVWIADTDSSWILAGVRIETDAVILVGQPRM